MSAEPEVPNDLKELYELWKASDDFTGKKVIPLIERIAALEAENTALKAPVSDEEWERATDNCPCDGLDTYDYYLAAARTLIAARSK